MSKDRDEEIAEEIKQRWHEIYGFQPEPPIEGLIKVLAEREESIEKRIEKLESKTATMGGEPY